MLQLLKLYEFQVFYQKCGTVGWLIRKLILAGILAAAVIVIAPSLLKGNPHAAELQTLKNKVDNATQGEVKKATSEGFGGILANPVTSNDSKNHGNPGSKAGTEQTGNANTGVSRQTYTGQVFENENGNCQVSVPGMAQTINGQQEITHIIQVPDCNLPVNQPVQVTSTEPEQNGTQSTDQGNEIQVIPYANSNNDGSTDPAGPGTGNQTASDNQTSDPTAPPYFQTVQLNAINQGSTAVLSYDDTTGKTIQVTVTMRNSQKVLFSGTFYSSQFHTQVNDIPNTPHMIEMTIENAIYGTLRASIYAPPNIQNSTISGIFGN